MPTETIRYIPEGAMGLIIGKKGIGLAEIETKSGARVSRSRGNVLQVTGTDKEVEKAHLVIKAKICLSKKIQEHKYTFAVGGDKAFLKVCMDATLKRYVVDLKESATSTVVFDCIPDLEKWIESGVRKAQGDMKKGCQGAVEIYQGTLGVIPSKTGGKYSNDMQFSELMMMKERRDHTFDFLLSNSQHYRDSLENWKESSKIKFKYFHIAVMTPSFRKVEWRVFYQEEEDGGIRVMCADDAGFSTYHCKCGIGYVYFEEENSFKGNVLVGGTACIRIKFPFVYGNIEEIGFSTQLTALKENFFQHIELDGEGLHHAEKKDVPTGFTLVRKQKKHCSKFFLERIKQTIVESESLMTDSCAVNETKVMLQDLDLNKMLKGNRWDNKEVVKGISNLFDLAMKDSAIAC